ncbi:MAG: D-amino-acid transaminase [Candidatus Krumholzibacteria bacterium]|nr:D-amino-acid transaminase [Candidatus Krumholzibacteria bacterium]
MNEIVFLNGSYIKKEEAAISPDDRGFLFADGVYEVVRVYNGNLFQIEDHVERLAASLEGLKIGGIDPNSLVNISGRLVFENRLQGKDALIYIQITRGVAPRTHAFPSTPVSPTIYAKVWPQDPPREQIKKGIKTILVPDARWDRCNIKTVFLLPNVLARQKAEEVGAGEALFVRDGMITEGSASNFAAVFGGTLVTHPDGGHILSGITKKAVIAHCRETGMDVEERPVMKGELTYAEEAMVMSTTREIMPVTSIDGESIGTGAPGPVTRRIQKAFSDLIQKECGQSI